MAKHAKHAHKAPVVHDPRRDQASRGWRWVAAALALAGFALTMAHVHTTPVVDTGSFSNAPDEAAHRGYIRVLVERGRLPRPEDRDLTYEWHQPPLYYVLAAPSDDIGGARAGRTFSALLGLLALVPLYMAARLLFPADPALAALAVGLAALLPMRHAVYGSASNDPLTELTFSCVLLLLLRTLRSGLSAGRAVWIGLALAAALLTKLTALLLVPLFLLAALMARKQTPGAAAVARNVVGALVIVAVCAGWWFARNRAAYGELMPARAFANEFAGTSKATDWIGKPVRVDLWSGSLRQADGPMNRFGYWALLKSWTWRTLIGAYTTRAGASVGAPRFLPPQFYLPYLLLTLAGLSGLARGLTRDWRGMDGPRRGGIALLVVTYLLVAASFGAFVWTWFQAQGRYLYPAMLPLAVLCAYGLRAAVPDRWRDRATVGVLALLLLLALTFYLAAIQPAYA